MGGEVSSHILRTPGLIETVRTSREMTRVSARCLLSAGAEAIPGSLRRGMGEAMNEDADGAEGVNAVETESRTGHCPAQVKRHGIDIDCR